MPKWQANDIYENNFRINKGDGVTMFYKDGITGAAVPFTDTGSTAFSTSGQKIVDNGAITLSAAATIVAAALIF